MRKFFLHKHSPISRLYRMGLVNAGGEPELLGIETLASVCSGCLYDDMAAFYKSTINALHLYREMLPMVLTSEPQPIFDLMVREYAAIGEAVPKPLKELSCEQNCLLSYVFSFLENWRTYLVDDNILEE